MNAPIAALSCPDLTEELAVAQRETGGAVVTGDGWPHGLELRVGEGGVTSLPCPYGNFSELSITGAVVDRLGTECSYLDLLTLATLEPELFG